MKLILLALLFLGSSARAAHELTLPPNELGQVMVLMYHHIHEPEGEWQRTPANFRKDMETLYAKGYYLVNVVDLIDGHLNVPAGKTPVALSFDDGAQGQFRKIGNDWDPDCAVGILKAMHDAHPDFGLAGSFYLNPDGKRSTVWSGMLQEMVKMGFELGQHTVNHLQLKKLDQAGVAKEIAGMQAWLDRNVPNYHIRTMALPFGIYPKQDAWAVDGESGGVRYHHEALLEVGANPGPSPYSKRFRPLHMPRVRGSDPYFGQWVKSFDTHPELRFISDGLPDVITVPKDQVGAVRTDLPAGLTVRTR